MSVIRSLAYNAVYQHYVRIIRLQTRHGENVLTADCPCHNASKAHLREYMSRRTVQSVINALLQTIGGVEMLRRVKVGKFKM